MAIFSDAFRSLRDRSETRLNWASILLGEGISDVESRVELAIRMMSPPIAHGLLSRLASNDLDEVLEGLGAFWAVCISGMTGWNATELTESGIVVEKDGIEALVMPVALDIVNGRVPQSLLLKQLTQHLETAIAGRRFVIHVKRDLPGHFDPMTLVQPVQNWVHEIERGQWSGGYAIYEDDDVSLELCLLDETAQEGQGRMLFHVPPLLTETVLRQAIPEMVNSIGRIGGGNRPVVLLMLSNDRWPLNPAMMLNVLYGRCASKWVDDDGSSHHKFLLSGLSLLANDAFKGVGAVWWLGPSESVGLIEGVSHSNPWKACSLPAFPGHEFRGEGSPEEGGGVYVVKNAPGPGDVIPGFEMSLR